MVLILVPGLVFGAIDVLVPLELDDFGAGPGAIAAVFLLAAALEAIVAPVAGRVSDRRGRFGPSAAGLAATAVAAIVISLPDSALVLGIVVVAAAPWIGMLWSPAMAMMSDGAESSGVDQGLAFGIVNLGWGLGHTAGAVAIPAVADATSNDVAYAVLAVFTAAPGVVCSSGARASSAPWRRPRIRRPEPSGRVVAQCVLDRPLGDAPGAVLPAPDDLEAGPVVVDRRDLDVDHADRERGLADGVLVDLADVPPALRGQATQNAPDG